MLIEYRTRATKQRTVNLGGVDVTFVVAEPGFAYADITDQAALECALRPENRNLYSIAAVQPSAPLLTRAVVTPPEAGKTLAEEVAEYAVAVEAARAEAEASIKAAEANIASINQITAATATQLAESAMSAVNFGATVSSEPPADPEPDPAPKPELQPTTDATVVEPTDEVKTPDSDDQPPSPATLKAAIALLDQSKAKIEVEIRKVKDIALLKQAIEIEASKADVRSTVITVLDARIKALTTKA